jgi:hypothetical protein
MLALVPLGFLGAAVVGRVERCETHPTGQLTGAGSQPSR